MISRVILFSEKNEKRRDEKRREVKRRKEKRREEKKSEKKQREEKRREEKRGEERRGKEKTGEKKKKDDSIFIYPLLYVLAHNRSFLSPFSHVREIYFSTILTALGSL
jgi:hypothetical protein